MSKKTEAAPPKPVQTKSAFELSLTEAAFTPKELDTLRTVCRDSENELGRRALEAGLARAGK